MANVNSVNKTLEGTANSFVRAGQFGGVERVIVDSYEASGVSIADTITFQSIVNGATLVSLDVVHDALGASSTLAVDVGATEVIAAAATSSAGTLSVGIDDGLGLELSADGAIVLTVGGGAVTGTIRIIAKYVTD